MSSLSLVHVPCHGQILEWTLFHKQRLKQDRGGKLVQLSQPNWKSIANTGWRAFINTKRVRFQQIQRLEVTLIVTAKHGGKTKNIDEDQAREEGE